MTVYVVMRGLWDRAAPEPEYSDEEADSGDPVAVYFTEQEGYTALDALEAQARAEVSSPFHVGGSVVQRSGISEDEFVAAVRQLGLPAPTQRTYSESEYWDWAAWYDDLDATMTPEQRAGLWKLLGRMCFYKLVAVEAEDEFASREWDDPTD